MERMREANRLIQTEITRDSLQTYVDVFTPMLSANEQPRPEALDPSRVAGHADTELFCGCADVDAAYAFLRASGCHVERAVHYTLWDEAALGDGSRWLQNLLAPIESILTINADCAVQGHVNLNTA